MTSLNNISDFFSRIGCPFQVYEMGRLILPVSAETFLHFEQTQTTWPYPLFRQAWFAILFWLSQNESEISANTADKHYVWFLKFPLDEQGKLNQTARNDFMQQLFSALNQYLADPQTDPIKKFQSLETGMKHNPYGFKPNQERMASFHSAVHQYLHLPGSRFYKPALEYLTGKNGFEQWNFVGFQGLADVAARLDETFNGTPVEHIVSQAMQQLPDEPLIALLHCLENHALSDSLSKQIAARLQIELEQEPKNTSQQLKLKSAIIAALIRGIARSRDSNGKRQALIQVMQSAFANEIEIIAAISARCWLELQDPELLALFLEALAKQVLADKTSGQNAFNAVINDLVFIPGMRKVILKQFRSPDRSSTLVRAIGAFFNQLS